LGDGVVDELWGDVLGAHAVPALAPGLAGILGVPDAAGRHGDRHVGRVARVDADRMNAGQVGATADPLLAVGMVPQRAYHLPARTVIAGAEKPAGERAAPDHAGLVAPAGGERPDARRAPIERSSPHVVLLQ